MKTIITIIIGTIIGYFFIPQNYSDIINTLITVVLCILLFCIGFGVGTNKNLIKDIKEHFKMALTIPLGIIIGSLVGGALCSFLLKYDFNQSLAIASGYGWSSLAAVVLKDRFGITVGVIGVLVNILRWLISLIFIPFVVKYFNGYSAIALGGANSMDISLEPIIKTSTKDVVLISILNGVILSMLTPIILTYI